MQQESAGGPGDMVQKQVSIASAFVSCYSVLTLLRNFAGGLGES